MVWRHVKTRMQFWYKTKPYYSLRPSVQSTLSTEFSQIAICRPTCTQEYGMQHVCNMYAKLCASLRGGEGVSGGPVHGVLVGGVVGGLDVQHVDQHRAGRLLGHVAFGRRFRRA